MNSLMQSSESWTQRTRRLSNQRRLTYNERFGQWQAAFGLVAPENPALKRGFRTFNLLEGSENLRATGIWCLSYMDPSINKFSFIEDDSNEIVNDASCITIKPNFHFSPIYLTSRTTEQNGDDDGHKQPFSKYTGKLSNFAWNSILHSCSCSRKLTSIPSNGRMRVFYKTEKDRSDAIRIFEDVVKEMTSAVRAAGDFFRQDQDSAKNLVFDHKVASHVLDVWEM